MYGPPLIRKLPSSSAKKIEDLREARTPMPIASSGAVHTAPT
jgi:hypothetical protein